MKLVKKALIYENLSPKVMPTYTSNTSAEAYLFNPDIGGIFCQKKPSEEITVELTNMDNVKWDEVFMEMLALIDMSKNESQSRSADAIDNPELLREVESYFADYELLSKQIIVHPDNAKDMLLFDVRETILCPKDKAYFLPPAQYLGVFVTQAEQAGLAIINAYTVFGVDIKKSNDTHIIMPA